MLFDAVRIFSLGLFEKVCLGKQFTIKPELFQLGAMPIYAMLFVRYIGLEVYCG